MSINISTHYRITCDVCQRELAESHNDVTAAVDQAMGRAKYLYDARLGRSIFKCHNCIANEQIPAFLAASERKEDNSVA